MRIGVDYYPEHWPKERWAADASMMREMGIQIVRMAEFSWEKFEPAEGEFHFEWLQKIMDNLYENGIYTILATPSGARPAWLDAAYFAYAIIQAFLPAYGGNVIYGVYYKASALAAFVSILNFFINSGLSSHTSIFTSPAIPWVFVMRPASINSFFSIVNTSMIKSE